MALWIECDSGQKGGEFLKDAVTRKSPEISDNTETVVKVGSFRFGKAQTLSGITQLDIGIYESNAWNATAFLEKTISSGLAERTERSSWNNRLAETGEVTLSAAELNYDLGTESSADLWCRITATLSGGATNTLGEGKLTITA